MTACTELLLAVLSIDPDAYGDYRVADGVLSFTYYRAGETPKAWHPCELEALEAYAEELRDDATEQGLKNSERVDLLSRALLVGR